MKKLIMFSLLLLAFIACSVSKSTVENDAASFMRQFEEKLAKGDSSVLDFFSGSQSRASINAAIQYLRNPEPETLNCLADFSQPTIVWDSLGLRAIVNVALTAEQFQDTATSVTFWLERNQGKFSIDRIEAEEFHSLYTSILYTIQNKKDVEANTTRMKKYLDASSFLSQSYDSVVWFSIRDTSAIYYVVSGNWSQPKPDEPLARNGSYKMGVVDARGNVIVPVEYDLVGSPGAYAEGLLEVQRDGKVGYYSIDGKEIVAAQYERAIPYPPSDKVFALVTKNSIDGWISNNYTFTEGYPGGTAEKYLKSYEFMSAKIILGEENYSVCHTPDVTYANEGVIIPPAYLVDYGIFDAVESGFTSHEIGSLTEEENYGDYMGTQFISQESFRTFDISNGIRLLISTIKSRFIGGREEFYYTDHFLLVNDSLRTKSRTLVTYIGDPEFRKIDGGILEAKSLYESSDGPSEPNEFGCYNCPSYSYFRITADGIENLEAYGSLNIIKYARLDSSYFVGSFDVYDEKNQSSEVLNFVPHAYLLALRNEILALNGFDFADAELKDHYSHEKWYTPSTKSYDQILETASDLDKHNLKFLEPITGRLEDKQI